MKTYIKHKVDLQFWYFLVLMFLLLFLKVELKGQNINFTQRRQWDGPFDIKLIAAPNLQAVYLDPARAVNSQLFADSLVTHETMIMSGTNVLEVNNRYKGGNPFVQIEIPLPALLCPNPNLSCMQGMSLATPNSSCPTKYNDPTTVSRYLSMTYSDYDNDLTTFSSSMCELDISKCSEIEAAYLYWTGNFSGSNNPAITLLDSPLNSFNGTNANSVFNASRTSGIGTVRLKIPGSNVYQNVTATTTNTGPEGYMCVSDVTNIVRGSGGGQFWVANIQSYPNEDNGGSSSGWVMVVVFKSPLSPPRLISLWDGYKSISSGGSETFTLTGLQAPSTANFKSYVGFAALDGENLAGQLASNSDTPEGLGFQTNAGGPAVSINPFAIDQPKYKLWNKKGLPALANGNANVDACKAPLFDANWASVYDGVSSSHITTYTDATGKNGNELVRLPSNPNTLGFDAHHFLLPSNAVAPGATQAQLTVQAGPQGGTTPFMAYVAIERLQPKLEMTKASDVSTTVTNNIIKYTLKIKNTGNTVSLGGDIIRDTLDLATDYVVNSLVTKNAAGVVTTGIATLTSSNASASGQILVMNLARSIAIGDSVFIEFQVRVKPYSSNTAIWNDQCKRTITNTAWVGYKTATSGILFAKSNGNDCGIGTETKILVQDPLFNSTIDSTLIPATGEIDPCAYKTDDVITRLRNELVTRGFETAATVNSLDLRNGKFQKLSFDTTFANTSSVKFFAIKDYSGAQSGKCQKVYVFKYKSCTTPVNLISFSAELTDEGAFLNWLVSSNKDISHIEIQRSFDGKEFVAFKSLKSQTISTRYSFYDNTDETGNVYYRLKIVENSGEVVFSNVESVKRTDDLSLEVFPNPFDHTTSVSIISKADLSFDMKIMDLSGKLIYVAASQMSNNKIVLGDGLKSGTYILEINLEDNKLVRKVVKY